MERSCRRRTLTDKLLTVLRPLLKRSPLCRGAMLVRMVDDGTGEFTPQRSPV